MVFEQLFGWQAIPALIITVAVMYLMRRFDAWEILDEYSAGFKAWKYKNYVLAGMIIIMAVVFVAAVLNVLWCINTPTCYGWPIREYPADYFNASNISKAIGVNYLEGFKNGP